MTERQTWDVVVFNTGSLILTAVLSPKIISMQDPQLYNTVIEASHYLRPMLSFKYSWKSHQTKSLCQSYFLFFFFALLRAVLNINKYKNYVEIPLIIFWFCLFKKRERKKKKPQTHNPTTNHLCQNAWPAVKIKMWLFQISCRSHDASVSLWTRIISVLSAEF